MSCLHPFKMLVPSEREGYLKEVLVPCGKCVECLKRKQSEWIFRLSIEQQCAMDTLFITLTYDDSNLPLRGVQKDDCQKFIKRYRKHHECHPTKKIKYFLVSEYGSTTGRPHYHLILFFNWKIELIPESSLLQECWKKGAIKIGTCSPASISYCCKYLMKENKDPFGFFENKTFTLMSRRPAIGIEYLFNREVQRLHTERVDFQVISPDGYILNLPRYYRDKLFDDFDKWLNREKLQDKFNAFQVEIDSIPEADKYYKIHRLEQKRKQKNIQTDKL